jgi:hypothetical protein
MASLRMLRGLSDNLPLVCSGVLFFFSFSLTFPHLNGYLAVPYHCSAYLLLCNSLADNMADSLCNVYVLISDTRFTRACGAQRGERAANP